MIAADMDNDGDQDIVAAFSVEKIIAWTENTDGNGDFQFNHIVSADVSYANSIAAADLDSDGDMDILSASREDNMVAWYENKNGKGQFGAQQRIIDKYCDALDVSPGDFDGDGDTDVLAVYHYDPKDIVWFENSDGAGTFVQRQELGTTYWVGYNGRAYDFDMDGDLDVVATISSRNLRIFLVWFENIDGAGQFSSEKVLFENCERAFDIADFDGNAIDDILFANEDRIYLLKRDADFSLMEPELIYDYPYSGWSAYTLYGVDLDNDLDMDVAAAFWHDNSFIWLENFGQAPFSDTHTILNSKNSSIALYPADFNADGFIDLTMGAYLENVQKSGLYWCKNLGKSEDNRDSTVTSSVLFQNYPNPLISETTFSYQIAATELVSLDIYNVRGQKVTTLFHSFQDEGRYSITWQPETISNGLYFCRLKAGDFSDTKKILLQR